MPILSLHPAEANRLYELIDYPSSWLNETKEIQQALAKASENTAVQN